MKGRRRIQGRGLSYHCWLSGNEMDTGSVYSSQAMSNKPRLMMSQGQERGLEPHLSPSPPEGTIPLESRAFPCLFLEARESGTSLR